MGDSSKYDRSGDDFLPNYDVMYFPRSGSEDSMARLDNLSSHGRGEDRFMKNRRHAQQLSSAGPPMVHAAEVPMYKSGLPNKEIDVDLQNLYAVAAIEGTMKKYADNLLRVLEGMNARLSQLESSVFTLNHSMGDLKFSVANCYGKFDVSLRSLSNNFTDVQRAMQLLRDKQEIFETHAELVKLQLLKNYSSEDSISGSFVAEAQVSNDYKVSERTASLTQKNGPAASSALQEPQSLQFNNATSPIFQESIAVQQTEAFMQTNIRPSLSSSIPIVHPQLCLTGNVDVQQSQPIQGLHPSTQHGLQMQSVRQPPLQQPPFLLQQPIVQETQLHQLQQTQMLQPSPQLPQWRASTAMQSPLQHDQSIQQPSQPSLSALSIQSPKRHLQAQQGLLSETQMCQSECCISSQGAFEARSFASHAQNLPLPAVYGASQIVVQPTNILPNQQLYQSEQHIHDYCHRVGPSVTSVQPVNDPQQGRYGS